MKISLDEFQKWFATHCDGTWEHKYGVRIESLDNPGWHLEVDLRRTELESKSFVEIEITRSEENWINCRIADKKFEGFGGTLNLIELVEVFLQWSRR